MNRLLGLGVAIATLTLASACDPGIDPLPICSDGVAHEVSTLEDPEAHERAAGFAIAGTASLRDDRIAEAIVAVDEPVRVEVVDDVCGDDLVYFADVTVSLEVADDLQLTLPATLRWQRDQE